MDCLHVAAVFLQHARASRAPRQPKPGIPWVRFLMVAPLVCLLAIRSALAAESAGDDYAAGPLYETNTALRAMTHAQMLLNAMTRGDAESAAAFTDPDVLAASGGVSGLAAAIRSIAQDANYDWRVTGAPGLARAAGKTYVIVTTRMRMTHKGERVTMESYLIGTSQDRGNMWTFADGSDKAKTRLLAQAPSLAFHLQFPVRVMRTGDSVFTEIAGQWVPDASTHANMERTLDASQRRVPPTDNLAGSRRDTERGDVDAGADVGRQATQTNAINRETTMRRIREGAAQGHAFMQLILGACYHTGSNGIEKNDVEGTKWIRKAAEQGESTGQFLLGDAYARGLGVSKNPTEAVQWFHKASLQGHGEAQYRLGGCYAQGSGVEQDHTEALKWFRQAAEQGFVDAQCRVAVCHADGLGAPQDYVEAAKWFRKAAERGNAAAQCALGVAYEGGIGVVKDMQEAYNWLLLAAAGGDRTAIQRLESVEAYLSPSEQRAARAWAKQWQPTRTP